MIPTKSLTDWLGKLVQIPSVNPTQAGPKASTPGEAQIAAQVADWFRAFGGQVQTEDVHPNRPNVYGIWQGRSERWIAVDVHTDTVGVEQMNGNPFSGHVENARVYGRGAVDTKATLAVILALLEVMHQGNRIPEANLLIAATADEEHGAQSAPVFANWIQTQQVPLDQLIIAEPTMCRPVYGHKGGLRINFTIKGLASHSAKPHLGKNAINAAAHLIVTLEADHERLQTIPSQTDLGPATMTVTLIQGGTGGNVVPDSCQISVNWRSIPGQTVPEIADHLEQLALLNCPLPFEMELGGSIDPFFQSPDTPWIRQLAEWTNQEPDTVPYGTNAWAHADRPYETVVLGPGSIDQAHGDAEWVSISQLEKLANIYLRWWGLSL